jgi:hypothetical protein
VQRELVAFLALGLGRGAGRGHHIGRHAGQLFRRGVVGEGVGGVQHMVGEGLRQLGHAVLEGHEAGLGLALQVGPPRRKSRSAWARAWRRAGLSWAAAGLAAIALYLA